MLKGLREAGCKITTICQCKGYTPYITRYTLSMRIVLVTAVLPRSVERVRYVINNLLHLAVVKYGVISLVLCIFTRLRLVTILSLLVKYLVIFHADPCNKSYVIVIPWF